MKCPHCQQYSLTYDWMRNQWTCHIYGGVIPDEDMPQPITPNQLHRLAISTARTFDTLRRIGVFT